jgi:hypothetical protein
MNQDSRLIVMTKTNTTTTTIRIEKSTKDRLESIGKMSDTYDTVINRLIDEYTKAIKE